jgi:hypothetical protein
VPQFHLKSFLVGHSASDPQKSGAQKNEEIPKKRYVVEHLKKRPQVKGNRNPTSGWPAMIF